MFIQIGFQDRFNISSLNTIGDLVQELDGCLGENSYVIENNGRKIDVCDKDQLLAEEETYKIWPKVLGGKGGFGSLLRSFGKQILISKNKEACRDLNGRRIRDVNNEKKLKEWMQKQLEKGNNPSTDQKNKPSSDEEKTDYRNVAPPHKFSDSGYDEQKKQIAEDVNEAVQIAAQLIQAEKQKKKKSSTAISTNDDNPDSDVEDGDNDNVDGQQTSKTKKRRHSEDALEDGELTAKKSKKEAGAKSAFFLGIDLGDVSDDDTDEDEEAYTKPNGKKTTTTK